MAEGRLVLRSINRDDGLVCVDLFRRDGEGEAALGAGEPTYGFEEYRRDPEDGRGWYPIGHQSDRVFADENEALDAAVLSVPWLREALGDNKQAVRINR